MAMDVHPDLRWCFGAWFHFGWVSRCPFKVNNAKGVVGLWFGGSPIQPINRGVQSPPPLEVWRSGGLEVWSSFHPQVKYLGLDVYRRGDSQVIPKQAQGGILT